MKKILSLLCALMLLLSNNIFASAVVDVPDVFGERYAEFDVNVDGAFNIRDLVRIKKYVSGAAVIVNRNWVNNSLSDAELLVMMMQALLKGDGE
ncbi:MAG: hypothetical protein IKD04_00540 [Clostridia bacterium]|nr:hypothetical protein [Clostridia bacterium]